MTENSCSEVRLSQGHLLPGFGKMMSKDVGLVVFWYSGILVGLVDRHTPGLGKMMSKDTNDKYISALG